ncbi:hypothetical protein REPUB_Repub09cG0161400 [Reevesia pubescens]
MTAIISSLLPLVSEPDILLVLCIEQQSRQPMVKTRQQKSKPKKQQHPHVKKQGKQTDISQFHAQVDAAFGIKVIQVTADGLLLISWKVMRRNMENIAAWCGAIYSDKSHFVPDINRRTVKCLNHLSRMMSHLMNTVIPWKRMAHGLDIWNCRQLPLLLAEIYAYTQSYHDEEHYNSVRLKEDPCTGPAMPIIIKVDADISTSSNQAKAAVSKPKGAAGNESINTGSIKLVMARSGCDCAEKVEEVLLQVDGDVDTAIEFLIAKQGTEEYTAANDSLTRHADGSYGNG